MKQENKKSSILITGHTRGIGAATYHLFSELGHYCEGYSRSTGFDVIRDCDLIVDRIKNFDWVVLNAYAQRSQEEMLKKIIERYQDEDKKVVVITSTSGTPICEDDNITDPFYKEYIKMKRDLIGYIARVQQELLFKKLNVFDVCPDIVDTDMTKNLWNDCPRLNSTDVAECVKLVLTENKYNINQLILQKQH
jgi:NAD(P)-dependent dehydrogenase (short-subunit alcohol dehydrogenase family)